MKKDLYTTKEAAEFLEISQSRVRKLIELDRLRSKKLGRDHLIEHNILADFKESGRKKIGRPRKK